MSTLLQYLAEFVKMILAVVVFPNYGAYSEDYSVLNHLMGATSVQATTVRWVLILTFGIGLAGVSISILKRLLCRN